MEWSRSETLTLAMPQCTQCHGSGLRLAKKGALTPCNCVLRCIFRICYDRFVKCVTQERHLSRISLEPQAGRQRSNTWGRKDEEFIADFSLVARRALSESEYRLFRYHFVLGADWKLCTRKLGVDRGNFFHSVYRIEQKLGRLFRELEVRNRDLTESLEQQTATAQILGVISSSPTDLRPVMAAVVEAAARLCDAQTAQIFQIDGAQMRLVARHGPVKSSLEAGEMRSLTRGSVSGRVALERRTLRLEPQR